MNQHTLAATFRQLHARTTNSILVLPNAWDAMSARVIEAAGARAIATTSAGVSWALGATDGQGLTRDAMAAQVRAIVNAVRVPVTADMESGYGAGTPDDVAATARAVIDAGAVGMNLEDSIGLAGDIILTPEAQADRIAAARGAAVTTGVDLFINARIDTMLFKVGAPAGRVADIVHRAQRYIDAGADSIFVPGVHDAETIRSLVSSITAPLNLIGGPGAPSVPALQALGVARVSAGPGLTRAVMAHITRAATEMLGPGTYESLTDQLTSAQANALFSR